MATTAATPDMIAKNLTRYAEAMALQLPLPFPHTLKRLRLARPTTRAGRIARALRASIRAAAIAVRVIYPVPKPRAPRRPAEVATMWQLPLPLRSGW